jgi:multidrug efflux pump subunit AcrA (membrane-fusion protein)
VRSVATLAAFLLALIAGCAASDDSGDEQSELPPPLPVNTYSISYQRGVKQTRSYTGTIRARQSSDLAFEVPGTIVNVFVSEGDAVTAGQELAQLDTRTLIAKQAALSAQIDGATAVLGELKAGPRQERIRSAKQQVNARQSDYQLAKLSLERRERLHKADAISNEELDRAKFGLEAAEANLLNAREQLNELKTGTRKEKLEAQASIVRQLKSSLKEEDVAIEKSTLLAPFAGTVSRRYLDNGSIAAASAPVVRLIESQSLEAIVGLPADVANTLKLDEQVTLCVGEREIVATVRSRVQEIDPVTRTLNVLLDVDDEDIERVVPGELCEWKIAKLVDRSGFWLPASALTRGIRGLWSVMVIVPNQNGHSIAEKRDVEIVLTESDRVLARGTLVDGDQIVVDGLHRLAEGQRVLLPNIHAASAKR